MKPTDFDDLTVKELTTILPPFVTKDQLLKLLKFGKSKLDYLRKDRLFPKPEKFGRSLLWLKSDIIEFVRNGFKMTSNLEKKYDCE
jgi:predicted DNA-binding transcriptional regulator AlpA